ncbi:MAG: hypothetical protein V3R16_02495 [Nitrospirales bacterium]
MATRSEAVVEVDYDDELTETTGAVLFSINGNGIWIPKSQIIDQDGGTITIPEWLAMEEGLI